MNQRKHQQQLERFTDSCKDWDDTNCRYAAAASEDISESCAHVLMKVKCPCPNEQHMHLCQKCYSVFCGDFCLGYEAASKSSVAYSSQASSRAPASFQSVAGAMTSQACSAKAIPTKPPSAFVRSLPFSYSTGNGNGNLKDSSLASFPGDKHPTGYIGLSSGDYNGENSRVAVTSCYPTIHSGYSRKLAPPELPPTQNFSRGRGACAPAISEARNGNPIRQNRIQNPSLSSLALPEDMEQDTKPELGYGCRSHSTSDICPALPADEAVYPAEEIPILPDAGRYKVFVTHVTDLNNFYLVREEDHLMMRNKMELDLATAGNLELATYNPTVHRSKIVTVNSRQHKKWVRGAVCDMRKGIYTIRLLDYGGFLEMPAAEVKVPWETTFRFRAYAYHCSMDVVPCRTELEGESVNGTGWDERINLKLRDIGSGPGLSALCRRFKNQKNIVMLYPKTTQESWGTNLVKVGLASWMFPAENNSYGSRKEAVVKPKNKSSPGRKRN